MKTPTPKELLDAALARDWTVLRANTSTSAPRLAQQAIRLLADPTVWAQHPAECRRLSEQLERARDGRSARQLSTRMLV